MTEPPTHDEAIDDRIFAAHLNAGQQRNYDDLLFPADLRAQLAARGLEITEIGAREKALREAAEVARKK